MDRYRSSKKNPLARWKRISKSNKLIFLIALIGLVALASIIALIVVTTKSNVSGNDGICLTPVCVETATNVLRNINLTADPCEDFYEFACGNFPTYNIIPEDKASVTTLNEIIESLNIQLKTLYDAPIEENEARAFIMIKSLYHACMNTRAIEAESLRSLKRILRATGGWPVVQGTRWVENSFDWRYAAYKFNDFGLSSDAFFSFSIRADPLNSTRNLIWLGQLDLMLPEEELKKGLNEQLVRDYYSLMVKVAVAFGAEETRASREMREVMELIIAIAEITVPQEELRNTSKTTNPMTIEKLSQNFYYLDWLNYINRMIHPVKPRTKEDNVIVTVPEYFQNLRKILGVYPKRTISNYMHMNAIFGVSEFLNDDIKNLFQDFAKSTIGQSEREPRWKECVELIARIDIATDALYVRNYFKKESKATAEAMVENIKLAFWDIVKNSDWIDSVTKTHAKEKIETMRAIVAYPDEILDEKRVEEYYEDLMVDPEKYLESMLNFTKFQSAINNKDLDEPVDKTDWRKHAIATKINAFYAADTNLIEISASFLQSVLFNNERPKYMNYGAIGGIIGHEITHGFDDEGSQWDKDGNVANWWQPQTRKAFEAKAQCIVEQYGNFTVPGLDLKVNGINTQGENIADNGGIKEAYLAYKTWSDKNGPEQMLPGLDFTPEQMFWIAAGNCYCVVEKTKQMKMRALSDMHSPNYFRINVPLMNSEYFAKDFGCPLGSKMNPEEKCLVW